MADYTQVRGGTTLHLQNDLLVRSHPSEERQFILILSASRSLEPGSTTPHSNDVTEVRGLRGSVRALASSRRAWQRQIACAVGHIRHVPVEDLAYWAHEVYTYTLTVAEVATAIGFGILVEGHFDTDAGSSSSSPSVGPVTVEEAVDAAASSPVVTEAVVARRRGEGFSQTQVRTDDDGLGAGVVERSPARPSSYNMPLSASTDENLNGSSLRNPSITRMHNGDDGSDELERFLDSVDRALNEIYDILREISGRAPARASSIRQALRTVTYNAEEEYHVRTMDCVICLESFNEGEELSMMPCSHLFHRHCLRRWLDRSLSCPACRCALQ